MTAGEIVARIDIKTVWTALGGGRLRHERGRAFWRDGDGLNISLNSDKAVFYDHASGRGGGVLDLVQTARACNRKESLEFTADLAGVKLDNESPECRQQRRTEFKQAARGAERLRAFRDRCLKALSDYERGYFRLYHLHVQEILSGRHEGDRLAKIMDEADECEQQYQAAEYGRDMIQKASWDHLVLAARSMGVRL